MKEINGTFGPAIARLPLSQIGEPEAREFLRERAVFPALRTLPDRSRHGSVTQPNRRKGISMANFAAPL